MTHGYLRVQDMLDPAAVLASLEARLDQVRVGLHEDVEVVLGHDWGGPVDGSRSIAQAFTSTIALGYSHGPFAASEFHGIARQLLRAAYLGTLLGAIVADRRRAVLTLIGGGVFDNPLPIIWEAILWAVDRVASHTPRPLDVVVNSRDLTRTVAREQVLEAVGARGGVLAEVQEKTVTLSL